MSRSTQTRSVQVARRATGCAHRVGARVRRGLALSRPCAILSSRHRRMNGCQTRHACTHVRTSVRTTRIYTRAKESRVDEFFDPRCNQLVARNARRAPVPRQRRPCSSRSQQPAKGWVVKMFECRSKQYDCALCRTRRGQQPRVAVLRKEEEKGLDEKRGIHPRRRRRHALLPASVPLAQRPPTFSSFSSFSSSTIFYFHPCFFDVLAFLLAPRQYVSRVMERYGRRFCASFAVECRRNESR